MSGVALVTGGASLIGAATARRLVGDGWRVALADIDESVSGVAGEFGDRATTVHIDVTDRASVEAAVGATVDGWGAVDALVNVAGGYRGLGLTARSFMDSQPAEWTRILEPNLVGVLHTAHAVLPRMTEAGNGAIVTIAASRGLRGGAQAAVYSAAKAAVIVFTQALAQEVAPFGVRVNTVAPGNAEARWKTGDLSRIVTSPLGRDTSADDVADAVAFLVSARAGHITGSCLDVSGGVALH